MTGLPPIIPLTARPSAAVRPARSVHSLPNHP